MATSNSAFMSELNCQHLGEGLTFPSSAGEGTQHTLVQRMKEGSCARVCRASLGPSLDSHSVMTVVGNRYVLPSSACNVARQPFFMGTWQSYGREADGQQ